jgi:hypothetical protein
VQPVPEIVPAAVAVVCVMLLAAPVTTAGVEFTPAPVAATLIEVAPPPLTGISPLYDCTAMGLNLTNTCCVKVPPA